MLEESGKPDYAKLRPVLFEMPTYKYLCTGDVIGDCLKMGEATFDYFINMVYAMLSRMLATWQQHGQIETAEEVNEIFLRLTRGSFKDGKVTICDDGANLTD